MKNIAPKTGFAMVVWFTLSLVACDKPTSKPQEDKKEPTKSPAPSSEKAPAPKADDDKKSAEKKVSTPDEGAGQETGNAGPVRRLEATQDRAPEAFPAKGAIQAVLKWQDKYGINALVFARTESKGKGEARSAMLTVTHALQEGDASWKTVRVFKERVDDCPFDIELTPEVGAWSVTDLDKDGLGEATFAYSAGCRSDVSPVTHKVLQTEDGKKYALRGQTRVEGEGGVFKADTSYKDEGKAFRAHAEMVWKETVGEFEKK